MNHLFRPERWFLVLLIAFAFPVALPAQAPAPQLRSCEVHPPHLHANLWMQTSAEYQALCRQTFNAALREVRQAVKSAKRRQGRPVGPSKQPLAVVADLDETILDNAKFQSEMDAAVGRDCQDPGYSPERWQQWERSNVDDVGLVPGAGPFIAEVERLKVVMVYISNRLEIFKENTIRALERNGIDTRGLQDSPQRRLLLRTDDSSKQARMRLVEELYDVVAYLGDNLGDFPGEAKPLPDLLEHLAVRRQKVEAATELWGVRWFILPNPVYGDWDRHLPRNAAERLQLLRRPANSAFVEGN